MQSYTRGGDPRVETIRGLEVRGDFMVTKEGDGPDGALFTVAVTADVAPHSVLLGLSRKEATRLVRQLQLALVEVPESTPDAAWLTATT